MKLLTVIPISRGVGKETLSYFSPRAASPGSIVRIPLRRRIVPALVVAEDDASGARADIRARPYALKKITSAEPRRVLLSAFISAARETARESACATGSVLARAVPRAVYDSSLPARRAPEREKVASHAGDLSPRTQIDKMILQTDTEERAAHYRNLIREEFARNKSVFFLVPTLHHAARLAEKLGKGIERHTFVLHGEHSPRDLIRLWNKAAGVQHPVLLVGLGGFLSLPRTDIGAMVVEEEQSGAYKQQERPYLDFRILAERVAESLGARFVVGDTFLRVETIWRYHEHELSELAPPKFRAPASPRLSQKIVDMSAVRPTGGPFVVLSDECKALVDAARKEKKSLFILAGRRGRAGIVVCADCDSVVRCAACNNTLALHTAVPHHILLCHHCGRERSADERCRSCGSWRLKELGIGIDLVSEHITLHDPKSVIFRIDGDTVKNFKAGYDTLRRFSETPGSILLGTALALLYLDKSVRSTVVASIDHLFALPDFRAHERIMRLILALREKTTDALVIQTRNSDRELLDRAQGGALTDFYRDEIAIRKQFNYPPWSVLVRVSVSRPILRDTEALENIAREGADFSPRFYESDSGIRHLLFKIPRGAWKKTPLVDALRALPPSVSVCVNPDSLF